MILAGVVGFGFMNGWFGGKTGEVTVPNFEGMTLSEAMEKAEEVGLSIEEGEEVYSPDQEKGYITSQTPSSGSKVSEGKVVYVNVSLGKKEGVVPNLIDKDYKDVKNYLKGLGFELGVVVKVTSTKPENTIISQSIEAGKSAERGTAIDVEISDGKGKEMKTVPFLIGKNIDEAKAEILAAGFKVGNINYEESTEYEKNKVTGQQYIGGTELEEGSAINILVSKGTPSSSGNSQGSGDSSDGESGTNSGEQQ